MSKQWKPGKKIVALQPAVRPSRIRRDPLLADKPHKKAAPISREREIALGVAGIVLFAIVITIVTVGFSAILGHNDGAVAAPVSSGQFLRCDVGDGSNCVVDGDTIRIADETVEIAGMEAPHVQSAHCDREAQRGTDAVERLLQILNSGKVTSAGNVREPDGTLRRKVLVDGQDVGVAMVNAGVARDYGSGQGWCA